MFKDKFGTDHAQENKISTNPLDNFLTHAMPITMSFIGLIFFAHGMIMIDPEKITIAPSLHQDINVLKDVPFLVFDLLMFHIRVETSRYF